jgi:SLA1 Homology Domain 1 (SHD1) protein
MKNLFLQASLVVSLLNVFVLIPRPAVASRTWTDATGQYTLEADLVAADDKTVVLQRADHELAAVPIDQLSDKDREYLKSQDALKLAQDALEGQQTWALGNGAKIVGRIVDYADRDVTLQRRRSRIYVNDRVLDNLPETSQQIIFAIVARAENLIRADRQSLETWMVRQRGEPRTFHVEGIVLETENGDETVVPFFLLSDDDQKVLKPGWDEWLAVHRAHDFGAEADRAFWLRSLAAARYRDRQVQREIAIMQLKLQAVQAGLTSLWEVTLYPADGNHRPPQWVVMPGRDSRQATVAALEANPGYLAGPVRRVAGG